MNNLPPHSRDFSRVRLHETDYFKDITIINRDGDILYRKGCGERASDVLRKELNLENWATKLAEYENEFIKEKIAILQSSLQKGRDDDYTKQ